MDLTEFCNEMRHKDHDFPETGKDLDNVNDFRKVMATANAHSPQVPFRRAVYMKLSKVIYFVDYMDTFCAWRCNNKCDGDFEEPIAIEVKHNTEFAFDITAKEYECHVEWSKVKTSDLPFHVLSVPSPTWTKTYPKIVFERISAKSVKVRFEDETFSFKNLFIELTIPGRYETMDGFPLPLDASRAEKTVAKCIRVIKSVDIDKPDHKDFIMNLFGRSLLKDTLVIVEWCGDFETNVEELARFKKEVCNLTNVFPPESE